MMELSEAAYQAPLGGSSHQLYAVQDSGNQLVTLTAGIAANGALTSAAATATQTLAQGYDFEGMAIGPAGSLLVAEESTPAIRRFDEATGAGRPRSQCRLCMPIIAPISHSNRSRMPDGSTYWTANEEALNPDGSLSTTSQGTTVRLQRFSYDAAGTLTLGPQYAYNVDPIHIGTSTDSRTRSRLVDLVALPDSSLLVLERSLGISGVLFGVPLYQYEDRIYRVTFAGTTDISQSPFNSALIGQSYTPVSKTLLWKGQVGGGFGQNMEGLALGPQLPGGSWSLLGVVDNGGGSDPRGEYAGRFFVSSLGRGRFQRRWPRRLGRLGCVAKKPWHDICAGRLRQLARPLWPNRRQCAGAECMPRYPSLRLS